MKEKLTLTKIYEGRFDPKGYINYIIDNNLDNNFKSKLMFIIEKSNNLGETKVLSDVLCKSGDDSNDLAYVIEHNDERTEYTLSSYEKAERNRLRKEFVDSRVNNMTDKEFDGVLKIINGLGLLFDIDMIVDPKTDEDKTELKRVFVEALNDSGEDFSKNLAKFCTFISTYVEIKKIVNNLLKNEESEDEQ